MANREQLRRIKKGVQNWNEWQSRNHPADFAQANLNEANLAGFDLSRADLRGAKLLRANLVGANLRGARLDKAQLRGADLRGVDFSDAALRSATLSGANLSGANLTGANLSIAKLRSADLSSALLYKADLGGADLTGADLRHSLLHHANVAKAKLPGARLYDADLTEANLSGVDLTGADLSYTNLNGALMVAGNLSRVSLVHAKLKGADLSRCRVFGISVWGVDLREANQHDLIITPENEPTITADNIEIAQFLYLLLTSDRIRAVIETLTTKVILILGRFTPARKQVLDLLRQELRRRDYLPIIFDFDKPVTRNFTETVSTLAHMARFIIADLTEPRSIPQELQRIIPGLPSVPVQPLLEDSFEEWGMFSDFLDYGTVLPPHRYRDAAHLLATLVDSIIVPAERKADEIAAQRVTRK